VCVCVCEREREGERERERGGEERKSFVEITRQLFHAQFKWCVLWMFFF
jgi:hypothetical protein